MQLDEARHLKHYEDKFIKFYIKFSLKTGNTKKRLEVCGEDLEYAYSLSQIDDLGLERRNMWKKIWSELNCKPPYNEYNSIKSSISHSLHGTHYKSLIKYLDFFLNEYTLIIKGRKTKI
jgi:hypothetical protein